MPGRWSWPAPKTLAWSSTWDSNPSIPSKRRSQWRPRSTDRTPASHWFAILRRSIGPEGDGVSRRKRLPLLAGAVASAMFVVTSCNVTRITGSGNVVSKPFRLGGFTRLDVEDGFHVSVKLGQTDSVVLKVDDNLLDSLDVRVTSGELHIG